MWSKNKRRLAFGILGVAATGSLFGCIKQGAESVGYWKNNFSEKLLTQQERDHVKQALKNSEMYEAARSVSGDTTKYSGVFQDNNEMFHGEVDFTEVKGEITGNITVDFKNYAFSGQKYGDMIVTPQ